jgi:hypothetical protein
LGEERERRGRGEGERRGKEGGEKGETSGVSAAEMEAGIIRAAHSYY